MIEVSSRITTRALRLTFLGALCALAGIGAFAGVANATSYYYCGSPSSPHTRASGSHCDGARHSLVDNQAYQGYFAAGWRVCAGAVNTSGNFYGSYACVISSSANYYAADHTYSGANLLYPRIHNGDNTQHMFGLASY